MSSSNSGSNAVSTIDAACGRADALTVGLRTATTLVTISSGLFVGGVLGWTLGGDVGPGSGLLFLGDVVASALSIAGRMLAPLASIRLWLLDLLAVGSIRGLACSTLKHLFGLTVFNAGVFPWGPFLATSPRTSW